ncbi:MAG: gephyrin-like molybdotransferase Glp [Syntrophales bacterium]
MITVDEALDQILSSISILGVEQVNILNALGRVLSEDIISRRNIPPADNSAMDGFAVRAADTLFASRHKPVILEVIEDIPAGYISRKTVHPGQAARIMTGAAIPKGADAVVRVEDTDSRDGKAWIFAVAEAGQDIRRAGEDVKIGEIVIRRGSRLRPAEIGMLASLSRSFVSVYQRPLVAILATGDELVEIDEEAGQGKIVDSNSYALTAQVLDCGAVPVRLGIAKDTKENLLEKFRTAARADIIVSSGGVSVGDFDFVKDIMKEIGSSMKFWRVAMRPGRPLAFGTLEGKPIFGLPGNPVSSMVSFEQFVRPSILKMMGHAKLFRRTVRAVLKEDIRKKSGLRHFIRAKLAVEKGEITAAPTGEQGSGILKSMVLADGLIVLPEDITVARAGDRVTVQVLE